MKPVLSLPAPQPRCLAVAALSVAALFLGGPGAPASAQAEGTPALTVSPTVINFGKVTLTHLTPPQTVTLTNTGSATAKFKAIKLEGINQGEYEISTNTCGESLDIGASCSFEVEFEPYDAGEQLAEVYIEDNASGSPQTVLLEGKGER